MPGHVADGAAPPLAAVVGVQANHVVLAGDEDPPADGQRRGGAPVAVHHAVGPRPAEPEHLQRQADAALVPHAGLGVAAPLAAPLPGPQQRATAEERQFAPMDQPIPSATSGEANFTAAPADMPARHITPPHGRSTRYSSAADSAGPWAPGATTTRSAK